MSDIQVSSIDLIVIGLFALAAVWHYPTLRPIGALLLIAASITPFTSPLSAPEKGPFHLPLDVIGGVTGVYLWAWHGEKVGKRFLGLAIASVLAGFVFTEPAMLYFGISTAYTGAVGALIGLLGLTLASNALRAVEKLDLGALFKGGIK